MASQTASELHSTLGLVNPITAFFIDEMIEQIKLFDRKQTDYGCNNIAKWGTTGCVIRASDKFERLNTLFKSKRRRPVNESILDSFRDIANYMVIAVLIERKKWPGV